MFIEVGEKFHVMYRSLYEKSTRRHFLGKVIASQGSVCRLEGYAFIYDDKNTEFIKKPEQRVTIINLAENGYIVNVVDHSVVLEDVHYKYTRDFGLVATDDKNFSLNINEFNSKS
jgi:hypothetical protein